MYSSSSRLKKPHRRDVPIQLGPCTASAQNSAQSLLMQLESVKSMMRYSPPNGTAGLARSRVSGSSRVPCRRQDQRQHIFQGKIPPPSEGECDELG